MLFRFGLLLVLSACLAAGCFGGGDDEQPAKPPEITLRVATFNLFYGGDEMVLATRDWCTDPAGCQETFAAVVDAIKESKADVVGLQEATGNTRKVAEALGWNYNERTQVISRFPIVDPGGADGLYVFVQPTPSTVVAISNVHLPSSPYGPYRAQAGYTEDQVLHLENRLRMPAIEEQVNELPQLAAMGIPVFLTGDFNSPSYLDWTEEADAARDDMPYPVEWPVSKALADAGFKDSYRVANPDPVARPGFTWTPGGPESAKHEVHDRIDWVLSMGPATATASSVVGEAGNENVDISIPMWPSDHRSVVSTFRVTPSPTPSFVAAEARAYEQGDEVSVRYHAKPGETVVIRPPSGSKIDATDPEDQSSDGVYGQSTDENTPHRRIRRRARRQQRRSGHEHDVLPLSARDRGEHHDFEEGLQGRRADRGLVGGRARHEVGLDVRVPGRERAHQPARGGLWRRLLRQRQLLPLRVHAHVDRRLDDPPRGIRGPVAGQAREV